MYKSVKEYYQFIDELKKQKEEFLLKTKESVLQQMNVFMSDHGWTRKGGDKNKKFTQKLSTNTKIQVFKIFISYNACLNAFFFSLSRQFF